MAHEKNIIDPETGEVTKVNSGFVQLYEDKIPLVIEIMAENQSAGKVLLWLFQHMDNRNALVVSQMALGEALGMSRTTVHYAVTHLKNKKALAVFKSGSTNIYAVNSQIAWKSDANGKRYALFDASVYISDAEQDKPLFSTQLVGHAQPKKRAQKRIKNSENGPI